ncbi:MAG: cytochrome c3 family protein [Pseudomonadota bacterium]
MSFVLNLTSRSASGREIVRTRRVDAEVLTIGRDPASDIHLTNLEVTRHHAEIRRLAPDRVAVRALASLPLIVDGRSTGLAEIDPARGGEIRIGDTRITVSADDEPGSIAIGVSRDSQPVEGADEASKRFSVAGRAFGKRPMAWLFGLLILAIFLVWPIWSFHQMPAKLTSAQMAGDYRHIGESWSSGPLSRAHAKVTRNCKACHLEAFVAVPDRACTACHTTIDGHADPRRLALARPRPGGIAGIKLAIAESFGRDPGRCVDCHTEHSGPAAMPVARVSCQSCHADLKATLPDTKLGNASDFGRDHPQFTPLVMTRPGDYPRFAAVSLDDPGRASAQNSGLKFPHALHMSRGGGVARMQSTLGRQPLDCKECHIADGSGARFRPVMMTRNCAQCHSLAFDRVGGAIRNLPHGDPARVVAMVLAAGTPPGEAPGTIGGRYRPGLLLATPFRDLGGAAARVRAIFSPRGACYDCHVVVPPGSPGGLDYRIVPVREQLRFLRAGRFDHAAHAKSSCASCHGEALTSNESRVLMLPGIATCRQCHGGDTARAPLVRSTCAMCHDYHHATETLRSARSVKLALWAPPRLSSLGALGGRGNADSPDFRFASWVRAERPGRNERAPP